MDPKKPDISPDDFKALEALLTAHPALDAQKVNAYMRDRDPADAPKPEEHPGETQWEDTEPEPKPQGEALATQEILDELAGSIAPEPPADDRAYQYNHVRQAFEPEVWPGALERQHPEMSEPPSHEPDMDADDLDLERGTAFTDLVGNRFYSPHFGSQAGEAMPMPDIQGPELDEYTTGAEHDTPRVFGRFASEGMPHFELPDVPPSETPQHVPEEPLGPPDVSPPQHLDPRATRRRY